jgi:hypothetical protein
MRRYRGSSWCAPSTVSIAIHAIAAADCQCASIVPRTARPRRDTGRSAGVNYSHRAERGPRGWSLRGDGVSGSTLACGGVDTRGGPRPVASADGLRRAMSERGPARCGVIVPARRGEPAAAAARATSAPDCSVQRRSTRRAARLLRNVIG